MGLPATPMPAAGRGLDRRAGVLLDVAGAVWVATLKIVNELHQKNVEREWSVA